MLLFVSAGAFACSCIFGETDEQRLERSDLVFTGKVLSIEEKLFDRAYKVRLEVFDIEKGTAAEIVEVETAMDSAACGYNFAQGNTYRVFVIQDEDGRYLTGLCSGNELVEESDKAPKLDLTYADGIIEYNFSAWVPTPCHDIITQEEYFDGTYFIRISAGSDDDFCAQVVTQKNMTGTIYTNNPIGGIVVTYENEIIFNESYEIHVEEEELSPFERFANWFRNLF